MDERSLRELELANVVKLYGLQSAPAAVAVPAAPAAPATAMPAAATDAASMGWPELKEAVRTCTACVLCKQRKQTVFGVGNESAQWLFVGEGPGAEEDEQGEPFVGQAGRLLDSMLTAIGLKRGREVYIANVVKCRPPGNRAPTPEESRACAPYLDRQIDLIAPRLIVALGKSAAIRLLGTEASVASLRGQVHDHRGIPVIVTYHPSYLLRSPPEKSKAWEDLVFARRTIAPAA
jgi:uracil-DNA glycosylase